MGKLVADWAALKAEYVTTTIGYRDLAKKYGIGLTTLQAQARKDSWVQAREKYQNDFVTNAIRKSAASTTDYRSTIYKLANKIAGQLETMTDNMTIEQLAATGIKPRDITGAIKDLEDVLHIKSKADVKEQAARIKNLEKSIESNKREPVEIVIKGSASDYAK